MNVFMEKVSIVVDFATVLVLAVPIVIYTIIRSVLPRSLKDVAGQKITGGGNGLGKAMAAQFAARGCTVILVDIDLAAAERTASELKNVGAEAYAFRADVSSYEHVAALAIELNSTVGPIDILVNNAGIVNFNSLQNTNEEFAGRILDVNIKSHVWMTKVFLEKMIENKRGHIVAISSMSGMYAFPWAVIYSTSKYAVNGFMSALTEQLRLQGHSKYIRTTCVCPYYIATRKDIVDFLKKPRFEILTTERTAQVIVEGILQNKDFIAIPPFFEIGVKIMQLFPLRVQQLVRDYIIREYDLNSSN
ncbi:17-beta-hydroxysteroid dehydrogenase 13-like isoform X3 [Uranotaenia lowii]|uniref:17-beta-hydroxysteroid dehydrogenase 13-like isoform X3 n=1 Tax=Uranotaenia lowii TaxID=190385 RepID=UPI00247938C9|nr:17-beta-hydroxysteroid dehydrogenase 13-like isoform X3 [Uranotaenia lowii]